MEEEKKETIEFIEPPELDERLMIPRATIVDIAKKSIPNNIKGTNSFFDVLMEITNKFIQIITIKANQIWEDEGKKLINPRYLLLAMSNFGLNDFITEYLTLKDIEEFNQMPERMINKKVKGMMAPCKKKKDFSENYESLVEQQMNMFKHARAEYEAKENGLPELSSEDDKAQIETKESDDKPGQQNHFTDTNQGVSKSVTDQEAADDTSIGADHKETLPVKKQAIIEVATKSSTEVNDKMLEMNTAMVKNFETNINRKRFKFSEESEDFE